MEVKICGLCRAEDAALATAAGADYLGVVLAAVGPRSRTVEAAAGIFAAGRGALRVGVFVDATDAELRRAADRLALDVLQLHGREAPERVADLREAGHWRIWKAVRPRDRAELLAAARRYGPVVDALLIDGWSARLPGGSGARFPWDEVAAARDRIPAGLRIIVAGGLQPDNVAEAVARLRPAAVDVSSGVERVLGEKDPERVRRFIAAAREAASLVGVQHRNEEGSKST